MGEYDIIKFKGIYSKIDNNNFDPINYDPDALAEILKVIDKKKAPSKPTDPRVEALRKSILVERKPEIKFSDIIGQDEAVEHARSLCVQMAHPDHFATWGVEVPRGILFYGPPGTGKTLLARAVASEANAAFMVVKSSDIMNMFVGESEKTVKAIFDLAKYEREATGKNVVIYLDEVDALLPRDTQNTHEWTRNIRSEFLQQLEGFSSESRITIIASTNYPETVTEAFLSRMQRWVKVGLPTDQGRRDLFQYYISRKVDLIRDKGGMQIESAVDFEHVASITDKMSGRDIRDIIEQVFAFMAQASLAGSPISTVTTEIVEKIIDTSRKVIADTKLSKRSPGFATPDVS